MPQLFKSGKKGRVKKQNKTKHIKASEKANHHFFSQLDVCYYSIRVFVLKPDHMFHKRFTLTSTFCFHIPYKQLLSKHDLNFLYL